MCSCMCFFFKQKTAYEMRISDWSSDVCSSDLDRHGAPNRHGYTSAPTARWWHAVDLISAGKWRELLETQAFTEPGCIMRAVAYGCRYSHHEDKKGAGYITTAEARAILRALGATEPGDPDRQSTRRNSNY